MNDDLSFLQAPSSWPEWPLLRVERRKETRADQPFCFVRSDDKHEVEPVVHLATSWPPREDDRMSAITFHYGDISELLGAGWRVVRTEAPYS